MKHLLIQLENWAKQGALRPLDLALTEFIHQHASQTSEALLLATALLSERNGHGHVCLDLQAVLDHPQEQLKPDDNLLSEGGNETQLVGEQLQEIVQGWSPNNWAQALLTSDAVRDERGTDQPRAGTSPLVLAGSQDKPLLYLRRYWMYEKQIQQGIHQRLTQPLVLPQETMQTLLDQLFAGSHQNPDWQKIACALAARSAFAIITGGPGTGKTTTVVRLLALLQGLQLEHQQPPLMIRLAAPTGKAAARLSESLAGSVQNVQLKNEWAEACRAAIPTEVTTLHRLLGSQPGTRHFRYHAGNPLPADLVVVDEASMVDVEMLAKLLDALTPQTRLILLGDKDQLASVEAGSVLGDLCQTADAGDYTPATLTWLQQVTGQNLPAKTVSPNGSSLAQVTTMLHHSYRFAAYPGIGKLAKAVNTGQATTQEIQQVVEQYQRKGNSSTPQANLQLIKLKKDDLTELKALVKKGYSGYLDTLINQRPDPECSREDLDNWALNIFKAHRHFQLLTAVRRGRWGVDLLNQQVLSALKEIDRFKHLLPTENTLWYSGRPVLIIHNDYSLKLMNGDIGICLEWPQSPESKARKNLRVAFPDGQGGIRWVLPSRLQGVETVFAMTVHKSQGSEFTHTALILPSVHNPVLSKELLYTGITRSSEAFTLIYSDETVLQNTLTTKVDRASGLTT